MRLVSPLVLLTLFFLSAGAGRAADLFAPLPEAEAPPALPDDDLTVRSRVVTMDLAQVERAQAAVAAADQPALLSGVAGATSAAPAFPPGTTLTLNLFDDVVVMALVEHTAPTFSGGYSISGHVVGEPLSTLTLVVNGETVAGTVRRFGETYHLRSVGEGLYTISEVEEPDFGCGVDALHAEHTHPH